MGFLFCKTIQIIYKRPYVCHVKGKGLNVMEKKIYTPQEKFCIGYAAETSTERIPTEYCKLYPRNRLVNMITIVIAFYENMSA